MLRRPPSIVRLPVKVFEPANVQVPAWFFVTAVIAVPFIPGVWLVGSALFFYGLANGVISPMQKSLLTQNAPAEMRGGVVSMDRLIQQVSKTTATSIVGLLLVALELPVIFWFMGGLSLVSVLLMAALLPRAKEAPAQSRVA